MAQSGNNPQNVVSKILIFMIGQVGCLALVIILLSVLGGLWLDNTFGTKPWFTLGLLVAGIPLSVISMVYVGRKAVAKITSQAESKDN